MNLQKMFSIVSFALLGQIGNAQSPQAIASMADFEYYAVENTYKPASVDSIRFIVSKPNGTEQATLVFLQGSGNNSILFYDDSQDFYFSGVETLMSERMLQKYRIVVLSKPGVPLVEDIESANNTYDNSRGNYTIFTRNEFPDYHIEAIKQVLAYLLTRKEIAHQPVYIVGQSQGARLAAKFAANYPDITHKVVCLSTSPFMRTAENFMSYRESAIKGEITDEQAVEQIYKQHRRYEQAAAFYQSYQPSNDSTATDSNNRWAQHSFDNSTMLEDLLKIQCPIYIGYGLDDTKAAYNDLVPLFFAEKGKTNLTLRCYPNLDHQFFYREVGKDGNIIKEEYYSTKVFDDVDQWLSQ